MGFFQAIIDFFSSIFNKNSPDVQKKALLKKIEAEICASQTRIFKNGNLLPNFAEAIRVLYVNTAPIFDILSKTICNPDVQCAQKFENQLVISGFSFEDQNIINSLSYNVRKSDFDDDNMTTSQIFDRQRRKFDKIITELGKTNFRKIDLLVLVVRQLNDLCKFNFITILQTFDPNYVSSNMAYQPNFMELPIDRISGAIEDLYYQISGLKFSNSLIEAICSLAKLQNNNFSAEKRDGIDKNVKEIAFVVNHVLSEDVLKKLVCYCHEDINFTPKVSSYSGSACRNFEQMLQTKFKSDEQRIKTEMKDENIRADVEELLGHIPLLPVYGYDDELNKVLLANTNVSFLWILPMQVLKTFVELFFTDSVRALLNNVVIEGFFNNPAYKTEFSADIYASVEVVQDMKDFEDSFTNVGKNSVALIKGYIEDAKHDADFFKKIEQTINDINNRASKIILKDTNVLNKVYKHITDLIQDARKSSSEFISNLKSLLMSSRNRDNTDLLEKQYPKWEIFFKIMKNYAIISS